MDTPITQTTTNLVVLTEHEEVFKNAEHSALALIKVARLLRYSSLDPYEQYKEINQIVERELAAHPEGYPAYLEERAHRETI